MLFEITKDSTLSDEKPIKPMEEAKRVEGYTGWFIEIKSLDELVALQDKYGTLELTDSFIHKDPVINIPDRN